MRLHGFVGAAVMICCILSGYSLRTARQGREEDYVSDLGPPPVFSTDVPLAILSHRKTGDVRYSRIMRDSARLLGMPQKQVHAMNDSSPCNRGAITFYWNAVDHAVQALISHCPGMRAVHSVRRPSSMVVSDYLYTKNLPLGTGEMQWRKDLGMNLRQHNMSWGLNQICESLTSTHFKNAAQMLNIHELSKNSINILEVRYEDFEHDYDATTASIFEHFLGRNHSRIDELVKVAGRHDTARMTLELRKQGGERGGESNHIADASEKANVYMEMKQMLEAKNPCLQSIVQMDAQLGYRDDLSASSMTQASS